MRLKILACDVLNREISYLSSLSGNLVDTTFMHQGLHSTPDKLRQELQREIDKANEGFPYNYYNTAPDYDYIILAYGLCSNGICGLTSKRIPMLIPRGHDCLTLLLGSKEKYKEYFDKNPGTYWFSPGWIERGFEPGELRYNAIYNDYIEKYGEDNAEYLMKMEQQWLTDYKRATYTAWPELEKSINNDRFIEFTRESATFLKWEYDYVSGNKSLMARLIEGIIDENEVLLVPAGKTVIPSYDDNIITCE